MPSRSRGRRLPPPHPPLIQEFPDDDLDLDVEVMKHEKLLEEINGRLLEVTSAQKRQLVSEERLMNVDSSKRQKEFVMDGLRVMAIDTFNQIILASGKAPGVGQEHILSKVNLSVSSDLKIAHAPVCGMLMAIKAESIYQD
ncbi:hypothetical protein E2562_012160 [Oryza meyeriana var. granulata]|uniref:Uncharacterized protein n=1 Tax=Oryza meyeriana var. granulata TaxID=110450 RepID=A0A6G1F7K1_9ORYZ|nr:hypothetical protein E2562_012160 [Oryza meyeriana var. granulata]